MGEKQEGDKKKNEGEKKSDGAAAGGSATVVMKFDMHCEGCAKKVRKSLKNFIGVENVKADCSTGKLTVVGKVDPEKLKAKVEEKTKKKVEIVSLQPNKASNKDGGGGGGGEEKKSDDKKSEVKSEDKKSEDKNQEKKPKEPQVATVLLKTRVHCEGCAQKIKKIIRKCDGVHEVNVDMEKDMITMKGTMDMKELLPYLNVKLKRNVEIAPAKKDDGGGGDKKPKDGGGSKDKPKEGGGGGLSEKSAEKKEGGGDSSEKSAEKKEGGGDSSEKAPKKKEGDGGGEKKDGGSGGGGGEGGPPPENVTKIEVNKMEYNPYGYGGYGSHAYTYDPRQQMEGYSHQVVDYWHEQEYSHPPQMFSDENPNACSVM